MTSSESWKRTARIALVVILLVAFDLWSKDVVWGWFEGLKAAGLVDLDSHGHPRHPVLGGWLGVMTYPNYGAAFGQFDQIPYVLIPGRVLAVILLMWLVHRAPTHQNAYLTSLVLIMSGALGNLYDNLWKPLEPIVGKPFGPVRDFIDVYFNIPALGLDWHFPTFNVADSCITCGAILLLGSGFFGQKDIQTGESDTAQAERDGKDGSQVPADDGGPGSDPS